MNNTSSPQTRRNWILGVFAAAGVASLVAKFNLANLPVVQPEPSDEHRRLARTLFQQQQEVDARLMEEARVQELARLAAEKRKRAAEKLSDTTRSLLDEAQQKDEEARAAEREQLESRLREQHDAATKAIPEVSNKLAEMKQIGALVMLMAKDRLKGTTETAAHLANIMAPVTNPMAVMEGATQAAAGGLLHKINACSGQLSARTLDAVAQVETELASDLSGFLLGICFFGRVFGRVTRNGWRAD